MLLVDEKSGLNRDDADVVDSAGGAGGEAGDDYYALAFFEEAFLANDR